MCYDGFSSVYAGYDFCVGVVFDGAIICFFFFFKQKTAYEMRISDWSSDVCSSDLWLDSSPVKSSNYRPIYRWFFWILVLDVFVLGFCGMQPAEIGRASCRERVCQYV